MKEATPNIPNVDFFSKVLKSRAFFLYLSVLRARRPRGGYSSRE